jgi:hypothetical protein
LHAFVGLLDFPSAVAFQAMVMSAQVGEVREIGRAVVVMGLPPYHGELLGPALICPNDPDERTA